MLRKTLSAFALLCIAPGLMGCSSMAKGVTEALLERKQEDTRLCDITGPGFDGISDSLNRLQGRNGSNHTKVLMVHGIGHHLPDYSARFREKLVNALKLDSMDPVIKNIELVSPEDNRAFIGNLKIFKYYNPTAAKDLLFYELTWSSIGDEDKEVIAIDDSEAYSYKRASLNKSLKSFMNATVPDLMVYEGTKRPLINKSVSQSLCWMFDRQWDDLPASGRHSCYASSGNLAENMAHDDYFVVTHSLGSRIATDAFNTFALLHEQCAANPGSEQCKALKTLDSVLRNESITVFMMANQLPLLQVGHPIPDTVGQIDSYCLPSGKNYASRLIEKTRIVAFSDPNDILSYPLPPDYAEKYIDSRTCPEVINVNINVAQPSDLFGLAEFANPLEAHVGYQGDDRVIRIITQGLHKHAPDPLISQKCTWMNVEKKEH